MIQNAGHSPGIVLWPGSRAFISTCNATVRGTYRTVEAGTRTQYVQYVGPWEQAALRVRCVPNAGGGYAQPVRTQRRHRGVRVSAQPRTS